MNLTFNKANLQIIHINYKQYTKNENCKRFQRSIKCVSNDIEGDELKIAGMGSATVDYLALVKKYPQPDEKLRTLKMEIQGGGNCANALSAVAKLGIKTAILSKVGGDEIGMLTLNGLKQVGIDTSNVVISKDEMSSFTYIITESENLTRTCIHTPISTLSPNELPKENIERLLSNAKVVYFDGRLTKAAIKVARRARQLNIPVLVEGESLREDIDVLIKQADFVVTSANFPKNLTKREDIGDAMLEMLYQFPNIKLLITTLGSKGSITLIRPILNEENEEEEEEEEEINDYLEMSWQQIDLDRHDQSKRSPDCIAFNGTEIRKGRVVSSDGIISLSQSKNNTISDIFSENIPNNIIEKENIKRKILAESRKPIKGIIHVASSAIIDKDAIVDTTGAGDAFIGSVLYGIAQNMEFVKIIKFASIVAACSCTALGARPGQPTLERFQRPIHEII